MREVIKTSISYNLTRTNNFVRNVHSSSSKIWDCHQAWSAGFTEPEYHVATGLKLKVRKFCRIITTFVEVTG